MDLEPSAKMLATSGEIPAAEERHTYSNNANESSKIIQGTAVRLSLLGIGSFELLIRWMIDRQVPVFVESYLPLLDLSSLPCNILCITYEC